MLLWPARPHRRCNEDGTSRLDFRQYSGMVGLSPGQLDEHLRRQMVHLHNSARLMDEMQEEEAVRLAATIRILLHQTRNSHALLTQMGIRDKILWADTARYPDVVEAALRRQFETDTHKVASFSPLQFGLIYVANVNGTPCFSAPLDWAAFGESKFDTWWRKPAIRTSKGISFSREQLVLAMANKDGGAHIDPEVPDDYSEFVIDNLGIEYTVEPGDWTQEDPPNGWRTFGGNIAAASIRQVAFEIQVTLAGMTGATLPAARFPAWWMPSPVVLTNISDRPGS